MDAFGAGPRAKKILILPVDLEDFFQVILSDRPYLKRIITHRHGIPLNNWDIESMQVLIL